MRKQIAAIVFTTLLQIGFCAYGSPPEDDVIIIEGKRFAVPRLPRPPAVQNVDTTSGSTGNAEGISAAWELDGDSLYLRAIAFETKDGVKTLSDVFNTTSNRVLASWFTGELSVPVMISSGKPTTDSRLTTTHRFRYKIKKGRVTKADLIRFAVSERVVSPISTGIVAQAHQILYHLDDSIPNAPNYPSRAPTPGDLFGDSIDDWAPVFRAIWEQLKDSEQDKD